ncbi:hypothetical protein Dimus_004600 [Dionaea muscipula]
MEGNKDEAAKAKELAEKKFQEKDVAGAKRLAEKAQKLFPSLDGLPGFLAALDVYLAAERKVNGELDWYGVLGVDPSADGDTVRKHYRKLALILHPDKNKSVGADGAFKILSEAWSELSDKGKRTLYDQKRNLAGMCQKVTRVNLATPTGRNSFRPPVNNFTANSRNQKAASHSYAAQASTRPCRTDTFWTACTRCRMQYEYLKRYLNHLLICPNCHESFSAIPMAPPQHLGQQEWSSYVQQQVSSHPTRANNSFGYGGDSTSSASGATREEAQVSATMEDAIKGKANAFRRNYMDEANRSTSALKGERPIKRGSAHGPTLNGNVNERASRMGVGFGVTPTSGDLQRGSAEAAKVNAHAMKWPNGTGELSPLETRNMLMEKARMEINKKVDEYSKLAAALNASRKEATSKEKQKSNSATGETQKTATNSCSKAGGKGSKNEGNNHGAHLYTGLQNKLKSPSPDVSVDPGNTEDDESVPLQMSVPDPDFHDFDKDRTENSFGDNQVWAAYDDDDGMPRFYAMIHGVISKSPFRMRMSWLNSKSNAEFGQTNWIACGFYKTSGDFRIGKHETNKSINSFSHKVKWTKGARGAIRIYPLKGDVWALYRNWSPEWHELTADEVIHKYDMVEVLEDFTDEQGVTVIPLVKVTGFKTVFRQHSDPHQVRIIPREEMFRFSHQVPSYLLTGKESPEAPVGCRELDPAATPLELLQVISEATTQTMMTNSDEVTKDNISGNKRSEAEDSTKNDDRPTKKSRTIECEGKFEAVAPSVTANGT